MRVRRAYGLQVPPGLFFPFVEITGLEIIEKDALVLADRGVAGPTLRTSDEAGTLRITDC